MLEKGWNADVLPARYNAVLRFPIRWPSDWLMSAMPEAHSGAAMLVPPMVLSPLPLHPPWQMVIPVLGSASADTSGMERVDDPVKPFWYRGRGNPAPDEKLPLTPKPPPVPSAW